MNVTASSAIDPVGSLVFETALGHIGIAWSATGLVRLVLPGDRAQAERRLAETVGKGNVAPDRQPPFVAAAIDLLSRYTDGETVDFSAIPLDFGTIEPFPRAVYAAARRIGYGETVTYGMLAEQAGFPGMARETGTALGRNPVPLVVPCHRIVAAGGRLGGFSAPGGARSKALLLAHEKAQPPRQATSQASFQF